jgi:predicted site-specific integrase-resolvase
MKTVVDSEIIPRKKALEILQVSASTLDRYQKAGILKPHRLGGKVFFLRSELVQALKGQEA